MSLSTTPAPMGVCLTEQQAAEYLAVSRKTLQSWRYLGGGPKFVKMGAAVRYRLADLNAWMEERTFATSPAKQ